MSEATLEAADPEVYEATDEAWDEAAASDAYRQSRQHQIMLARQAHNASLRRAAAHGRAPSPPSRRPDLETKVALDSLRRRLHEANRLAYRNAWAAEASVAASQVLDSFEDNLAPHDWARALIRGAPTLLISPGKPTKPGLQGFLFDPRVAGGAVIAAIFAFGHFRGATKGVSSINVNPPLVSVEPGASVSLSAAAVDQKGNDVPNTTLTWTAPDPAIANVNPNKGTLVTCTVATGATVGQSTVITVTDGTATGRVLVNVG
jgi:hypothetical protein